MGDTFKTIAALLFAALCGTLASFVVWISPSPMPAGNAQLLAAFIGLFSAGGYALLRALNVRSGRKR